MSFLIFGLAIASPVLNKQMGMRPIYLSLERTPLTLTGFGKQNLISL